MGRKQDKRENEKNTQNHAGKSDNEHHLICLFLEVKTLYGSVEGVTEVTVAMFSQKCLGCRTFLLRF